VIILQPYLKGRGPTLHVDLLKGIMTAHFPLGTQLEAFEWNPEDYNPGLGASTDLQEINEILSFAIAYADNPEEFEREPTDLEQIASPFWIEHGDSFMLETLAEHGDAFISEALAEHEAKSLKKQ